MGLNWKLYAHVYIEDDQKLTFILSLLQSELREKLAKMYDIADARKSRCLASERHLVVVNLLDSA